MQSSLMSHILKGLSARSMEIPHMLLFHENEWSKMSSKVYLSAFRGGGYFWRVTPKQLLQWLLGLDVLEL